MMCPHNIHLSTFGVICDVSSFVLIWRGCLKVLQFLSNQCSSYERELKGDYDLHKGIETTAVWVQGVISEGDCVSAQFIQNSYSRACFAFVPSH